MLTQLRAIFDLIIQFQNAQESFFSAATRELQSRQALEKAVEMRTDEVCVLIFNKTKMTTSSLFCVNCYVVSLPTYCVKGIVF